MDIEEREFWYSDIPPKLTVEGRPELALFPRSVMFFDYVPLPHGEKIEEKTSIYYPDLFSLIQAPELLRMRYLGIWDPESWLVITVGRAGDRFHGAKYLRGKCLGETDGVGWDGFFIHLGLLSVDPKEECMTRIRERGEIGYGRGWKFTPSK